MKYIKYSILLIMSMLFMFSCATKKYLLDEQSKIERSYMTADSLLYDSLSVKSTAADQLQDSLISNIKISSDTLFFNLMSDLGMKNKELDSLDFRLNSQAQFIDSLSASLDTLQGLKSSFQDADYSLYDLAKVKGMLDSLTVNQKHLSRELQYMIRDLNLIERNMMDIMNYSNNSIKSQMRISDLNVKRTLYKNNSKAMQMVMIYLMTRSSAQPEDFLSYIDSIYAMGDNLDTVRVNLPGRSDSILEVPEMEEESPSADSLTTTEADSGKNELTYPDSTLSDSTIIPLINEINDSSAVDSVINIIIDSLSVEDSSAIELEGSQKDSSVSDPADSTQNSSEPAPK